MSRLICLYSCPENHEAMIEGRAAGSCPTLFMIGSIMLPQGYILAPL